MELCNLTPHLVTIIDEQGNLKEFPSRGVATCHTEPRIIRVIDGISILRKRYKPVLGLPAQSVDGDKIYIVDAEVAEAARGTRLDVVTPTEQIEHPTSKWVYKSLTAI